jgi:hypothetical protein
LSSQAVADLEWVLTSPSLVDDPAAIGPVEFEASSIDIDHLEAFLVERHEFRVGRYFESLLHYWLLHVRQVELVGAGIQIKDENNRTLGEIDFLFRDEDGRLNHCEAAVKFFLHHPNDEGSHFPGPAARDNFERKSTQLFEKQLMMSEVHFPDVDVRVAFVRGRVFQRVGAAAPESLPNRMAADRLRGAWLRESELDLLETFGDVRANIVSKPHWFAPIIDGNILSKSELATELVHHFEGPAYPMMISLRDQSGAEVERCFVVPNAWPAVQTPSESATRSRSTS